MLIACGYEMDSTEVHFLHFAECHDPHHKRSLRERFCGFRGVVKSVRRGGQRTSGSRLPNTVIGLGLSIAENLQDVALESAADLTHVNVGHVRTRAIMAGYPSIRNRLLSLDHVSTHQSKELSWRA